MEDATTAPPPSPPPGPESKSGIPKTVWVLPAAVPVAGRALAGAIIFTGRGTG